MATVPGIMVDIGANVARMQQDMRKLTGTMQSGFDHISGMAMKLGGILAGAFSVHALISFGKSTLEAGDHLAKLSQSTGVSVENLSALKYAAKLADLDLDSLAKGIGKLSRNMFEAQSGGKEAAEGFSLLGISIADSQGKLVPTNEALGKIADKFSAMEDGTTKTALAIKIFGKAGADLIPLLNAGSAGIEDLRKEAEKLGVIMSTETAQQMERVNDNFIRLKISMEGVAIQIITRMLPTLENLTNIFVNAAKEGKNFDDVAQVMATGLKLLASFALVTASGLMIVGEKIGAWAAMIGREMPEAQAIQEESAKRMAERLETLWSRLGQVWDKGAEEATKGAQKIKKSVGAGIIIPTENTKSIENIIKKLEEEAETLQIGAEAHELFKKGLHEAGPVLQDYALYLIRLIEAHEQDKKSALELSKAMDEEAKQFLENETAIFGVVDALKMEAITAGMSKEETTKFKLTLMGASQTLKDNADAYYATIRAAKQYNDEIEFLKEVIEEARTPADRFEEKLGRINKLFAEGKISAEVFERAYLALWDKIFGVDEKKEMANREQILLDFADRFRKVTLDNADYAIYQIQRQAAIFKTAGADEVAVAIWAAKEKQKASREWQDGAMRGLEDYAAEATNAAKNVEGLFTNAFKGMEDALVDFITTGKADFKSFVNAILKDLARLAVRQAITGPLASGLSSLLSGLFSGGGAGGTALGGMGTFAGSEYNMGIAHRGGIIGQTYFPMRNISTPLLYAPRLHQGLMPDEYPAVLRRGEGVFTPEQMQAMGGTNISINIPINMPSGDMRKVSRLRRDLEGEIEPVVRRIIERYV
jgi:hypothetical protein